MHNFYGYEPRGRILRLASVNGFAIKELSPPKFARLFSSFTNFNNKFIFLIAGDIENGAVSKTGEVYDIHRNIWMDTPPLQVARRSHSTCSFNNEKLYTFGGLVSGCDVIMDIEVLNAKRFLAGYQDCLWECIVVSKER